MRPQHASPLQDILLTPDAQCVNGTTRHAAVWPHSLCRCDTNQFLHSSSWDIRLSQRLPKCALTLRMTHPGCLCRVQGIIGTIHGAWPGTEIILLGILPRGTDYWDGGSGRTSWPNVLTGPIESLNRELKVNLCQQSSPSRPAFSLESASFRDTRGALCSSCVFVSAILLRIALM